MYKEIFSLEGKVAIITGALGIIGRELCRGFAECGAKVAVVDLDGAKCSAAAAELSARYQTEAMGAACDLTKPEAVADCVAKINSRFGRLDILLNNAASKGTDLKAFFAPATEYKYETWREVMSVNLDGLFFMAKEVGQHLIAQGQGGAIIQTASIYGIMGPDNRIYEGSFFLGGPINTPPVYAASKGGVVALTLYLAALWGEYRIRVNTLTPGGVESGQNDSFKRAYTSRVPLRRMAQVEEIVSAAIFLASDAAGYVTGHNLIVDGGLHAW